eukprot:TRINITY_DN2047_c0_g3_i1.p1 TRINITY_DN2047_c0_g3~~TRINITY_DN2047_c0_g3_i1.p1  ORF type:complete len:412 (+),score=78.03 TRINITY_DN2047_c0_g3_i1:40-1275(+)
MRLRSHRRSCSAPPRARCRQGGGERRWMRRLAAVLAFPVAFAAVIVDAETLASHAGTSRLVRREAEGDDIVGSGNRWMSLVNGDLTLHPERISLFCFAFSSSSPNENRMLAEVRAQFAACDGSTIVVDEESVGVEGPDVLRVPVPSQANAPETRRKRWGEHWLYHRNMVAVLPAWKRMMDSGKLDKHDWILHSEFDHFIRPSRIRYAIAEYMRSLHVGKEEEQKALGGPIMLKFGNAFVFNAEMVLQMHKQWDVLGRTMPESHHAGGCPNWNGGWKAEDCPQDDSYPQMANVMTPNVPQFGTSGCGAPVSNGKQQPILPGGLACWQMDQSPIGSNGAEDTQLKTIRAFAALRNASHAAAAQASLAQLSADELTSEEAEIAWDIFFPDLGIPIIHHVYFASVHKLARELLGL